MKIGKIVATSGFFQWLHVGYLEYFKLARELGDKLIVFVDSDRKSIKKYGKIIVPENERLEIIKSVKYVDDAYIIDAPISEALKIYRPNVFAKGGDRLLHTIPKEEIDMCKKLNIEIVCGLGSKIQSSSELIKRIG